MSTDSTVTQPAEPAQQQKTAPTQPPRLWPHVVFVATFWAAAFIVGGMEKPYFIGFLYNMASAALLILLFFGWWWSRRRIRFSERLFCFLLVIGTGVAVAPFCHKTIWFGLATLGLPAALTTWTLWMLLLRWT